MQFDIGELFINKIMKAKPSSVEMGWWAEMIFGLHERYIIQYQANRTFHIEGLFRPVPDVRISGIKNQIIRQGKRVWIRFDEKLPNVIDLEAPIGVGEEPKLFQLTFAQWHRIRMWLNPVHKKDEKLHERTNDSNFGNGRHSGE